MRNSIGYQDEEVSGLYIRISVPLSNPEAYFSGCSLRLPLTDCTVDNYLSYSFIINGYDFGSLNDCLSASRETLLASELPKTILAAGLGDATSSNIMIDAAEIGTPFHFVDFEMAGFQNPFVDLGWSVPYDCFFTANFLDSIEKSEKEEQTTWGLGSAG